MKFLLSAALAVTVIAGTAHAQVVQRSGYVTDNGTYVAPSYATRPDGNRWNNFSTQGNINPYTGERGTRDPRAAPSNPYLGSLSRPSTNPYSTKPRRNPY